MYDKYTDDDDDYDTDSIFGLSSQEHPLLDDITHNAPVLLSATLFQRNTKLAHACVMLSVVLERAAYYSLLGNLAYYLNGYLGYSSGHSAELVAGFSGMTWLSCFIGGVFGDMILGRFKTIITGLVFYIIGFCNLPILTYFSNRFEEDLDLHHKPLYLFWLIMSLITISLGEGCFKSNMSPFGADQLEKVSDNEMRSYFTYYYWAINIGCLLGFSLLTWLQQKYGFTIGYAIPCCMLLLALIVFCIPRTTNYHITSPSGNILKKIVSIMYDARRKSHRKTDYEAFNPIQHWLDRSKVKYGGKFSDIDVEDVKTLFSILPVFAFLIVYCICYYQIPGTFLIQGLHMRLLSFTTKEQMPASWFNLFNVIIVLMFVPIIDQYFYPMIERCGTKAPFLFRMSIGMLLATFSMIAAGTLEMYRVNYNHTIINHVNGNQVNITAQDMTIFLQIPQYGLMGISEILVITTSLEFAYVQSPKSMQSFVTSLFFVTNGLGAFLGGGLIALGNALKLDIIPSSKDHNSWKNIPALTGNLCYFFYFLAGLNMLNLFGFAVYLACGMKKSKQKDLERTVAAYIQSGIEVDNDLRQF